MSVIDWLYINNNPLYSRVNVGQKGFEPSKGGKSNKITCWVIKNFKLYKFYSIESSKDILPIPGQIGGRLFANLKVRGWHKFADGTFIFIRRDKLPIKYETILRSIEAS